VVNHISFWIPITLAKIYFFPRSRNLWKNTSLLGGTVLKYVNYHGNIARHTTQHFLIGSNIILLTVRQWLYNQPAKNKAVTGLNPGVIS